MARTANLLFASARVAFWAALHRIVAAAYDRALDHLIRLQTARRA